MSINFGFDFLAGGRAKFTASGNGRHYTFQVKKPKNKDVYFVSLLSGPDNQNSYTYMGVYNPQRQALYLTAKSAYAKDSIPVRTFRWVLKVLDGTGQIPDGYNIEHSGRCGRCNRELTEPESLATGLGPVCRQKAA